MKVVDWTGTLTEEFEDCECFYCGLKWKRHCDDNDTGWAMCHENGLGITNVCDECYVNPNHRSRNIHMVLENDYEAHPKWIKQIIEKPLRDQIKDVIQTTQYIENNFDYDDIMNLFCHKNSEMSIDRVLYELRTETDTPNMCEESK